MFSIFCNHIKKFMNFILRYYEYFSDFYTYLKILKNEIFMFIYDIFL